MSTLTGVNADAVRPALRVWENEVQALFREISRYCTGYESDISRLAIDVTSGNRFLYTPEKLKEKSDELETLKLKVQQERDPKEKRIEELRAKILLVENLKTQSLEDILKISHLPVVIVSIIDEYVESGFMIKDPSTGKPHYYA